MNESTIIYLLKNAIYAKSLADRLTSGNVSHTRASIIRILEGIIEALAKELDNDR